ncbi:ATP-binding protein [Streptomyces luteogriseus]|uniref:ATP-binding protein n=1 Tax=Streptomyces luteogriseus TaxID=68233 RepID=UPI0037B4D715
MTYRPDDGVGSDSSGNAVVLRWSRHPRCVGLARRELRKALGEWGLSSIEDPAVLVLSEILTNAIRHGHLRQISEIETRYLRIGSGVRIEVHDGVHGFRQVITDVSGTVRDLQQRLIGALADRWNEPLSPGVSTWVEFDYPSQAGATDVD